MLKFRSCECDDPIIRCDDRGCRCTRCGLTEGRRARSRRREMTPVEGLIARVEMAAVADRDLDGEVFRFLSGSPVDHWFSFKGAAYTNHTAPRLTSSMDDLLELLRLLLPGWSATIEIGAVFERFDCVLKPPIGGGGFFTASARSPYRSLLSTILRAVQAGKVTL